MEESAGASCGREENPLIADEEKERKEVNASEVNEGASSSENAATGDLRMIGDWYRDELEVTKMSSCANKSLNKLVETKKEGELEEALLLLATTDGVDGLILSDDAGSGSAAVKVLPNRSNEDEEVESFTTRQPIASDGLIDSSPKGGSGTTGWSVTFEQILASVLADQQLSKFFEKETDLNSKMDKFQSRKVTEAYSSFQNF